MTTIHLIAHCAPGRRRPTLIEICGDPLYEGKTYSIRQAEQMLVWNHGMSRGNAFDMVSIALTAAMEGSS